MWTETFSHFAICCLAFDTVNSHLLRDREPENDVPFPADGVRMKFPDSFGVIVSEMHQGPNWIAMVSASLSNSLVPPLTERTGSPVIGSTSSITLKRVPSLSNSECVSTRSTDG